MRSREWRRNKNLSKFASKVKEIYYSGVRWYKGKDGLIRARSWKEYMNHSRFAYLLKNTRTPYGKGVSEHLYNKYEDLKEKRLANKLMEEEVFRESVCGECEGCDYPDDGICPFGFK